MQMADLTRKDDGKQVLVNLERVLYMEPIGGGKGTAITFDNATLWVEENPDQIFMGAKGSLVATRG